MARIRIKWQDARGRRPQAPSIPQRTWEQHRELLKRLYLEDGMKLGDVMRVMKDEHSFTPSYVYICSYGKIENLLWLLVARLFAFAAGVSIPPSSTKNGVSTRGQVEAKRNRTSLPRSQRSNLRLQKALQPRAPSAVMTLIILRKRKPASRRSLLLNQSFLTGAVLRLVPVHARPHPQQIRIQTSAMKLWDLSIKMPQFRHRVQPFHK
jgi:hypothetical protein